MRQLQLRVLWPLPAWLLLAALLAMSPAELWQSPTTQRRTFSLAELSLLFTTLGSVCYWLTLLLSRLGLLHFGGSRFTREPSGAELAIADALSRLLCLALAYAGPLLVWLKR